MKIFSPFLFLFFLLMEFFPLGAFGEEKNPHIILTADTSTFELSLSEVEAWNHIELTSLYDSTYKSEWENIQRCSIPLLLCDSFLMERQKNTLHIRATSDIQTQKIKAYLQKLQKKINTAPSESFIEKKEDSNLFSLVRGSEGLNLVWDENMALLESITRSPTQFLSKPTPLLLTKIPSEFSLQTKSLGIQELVGQGTSDFTGSSDDRIFNIQHALKRFDAVLIAPGETFSFTEYLGPVEEWTGYRPELIIRNNKTEPEYGGGICQVSTTFFRASVNAGLEIIDRRNHSYPVSYYKPIGFDATVYYPKPDLRVKNNFSHNILFAPSIEGKKLTFSVYGTLDGRRTEVSHPIITEKKEDGSLKTQFTQVVHDAQGNLLLEDTFKSNYDSPDKYPHPDDIEFTEKPKDWSKKQWEAYKKTHDM